MVWLQDRVKHTVRFQRHSKFKGDNWISKSTLSALFPCCVSRDNIWRTQHTNKLLLQRSAQFYCFNLFSLRQLFFFLLPTSADIPPTPHPHLSFLRSVDAGCSCEMVIHSFWLCRNFVPGYLCWTLWRMEPTFHSHRQKYCHGYFTWVILPEWHKITQFTFELRPVS